MSADRARIVVPPPAIYAAGLAGGWFGERAFPLMPTFTLRSFIGWLLVGVALFWGMSCIGAFKRAKTAVNPYGTTTALVTQGPYRRSRNPMYLGLSLFYVGLALVIGSAWALLLLPLVVVVMYYGVIRHEEQYLAGKFGTPYEDYCARVRRWL
jgi:protein-S-isoprenylcysteine O-methyltransferase Ste14